MRVIEAPHGPASYLTAERRGRDMEMLADGLEVDLLVIGGGVTGAGVALDAVTRGLSVALLERRDLAHGTSRWSSKLVHGGLRYLAHGQFDVAWESARERSALAGLIAPHMIRALPQLIPVRGGRNRSRTGLMELGIHVGDGMRALSGTSRARLPVMRRIGAAEARLWAPALSEEGLRGAILSWDAQLEDDARLVVALARTAAAHGARVITYCEVTEVRDDGARARDARTGFELDLTARHVVNATGVWAGQLSSQVHLQPSRGSHLLVPAARLGRPRVMLNLPHPDHLGRFVFAIPRPDGLVMLGLTDEPIDPEVIPDVPEVPPADEAFLLGSLSTALQVDLGPSDVVGRFAGLRPLLAGEGTTADLSRRHAVLEDPDTGLVTVVGGKLTTYRRMAEDAVDRVGARHPSALSACATRHLQLVGAPAPGPSGPPPGVPAGLWRRFGTEAADLVELTADRPELRQPVLSATDVLALEWRAAVEREGALTLEDVLDRRCRMGLVPAWRAEAVEAAERVLPELTERQIVASGGRSEAQGRAASISAASE
ncbi:MAG TPA: glycerol-3-phosphate dehydrogenase/oxidase [Solirubrobacteraceae bacterium]|jgi:glycerol-3-phosphate dehydrogenase|nr:glycerol-3-phosphate dehydrogenase/oxidase [Solirubrobacteraceae bacterium]